LRQISRRIKPLAVAAAATAALAASALTATGMAATAAPAGSAAPAALTAASTAAPAASLCPDATTATFGPYVCVFTPSMPQAQVQADLDAIATQQVPIASQFTSDRYAIFFQPGTYGSAASPLVFQVGYYTQVAGLGSSPQDTVINGAIDVFNDLCTAGTTDCNADDNFWRSLSNVDLNVDLPATTPNYAPPALDAYGAGCANSGEFWAASQAAPLRRDVINGSLLLQDYCASNNYASGGFIADSQVSGDLDFYGNQQFMVRNSSIGGASGCPDGLWNMVYSGVSGAPAPVFSGQCAQNTVLATSPVTEEEPFLYSGASGQLSVFVPAVQHASSGTSWSTGSEAGKSLPLSKFFIASPKTPVLEINLALALGKNLVLTPGVYNLSSPIIVSRPDTVVLGQGFATLVPTHGNAALIVVPNNGVKVSGLIIDAGPVNSPALMTVGTPGIIATLTAGLAASDPDTIQDVFFRIGGAETTATSATDSLVDSAPHSIIDDSWIWRADHGNDVGWTANKGDTGLVVNGDDVTAYGLAVEHYQKSEVIWNGQGGTDVFFQNELPYDPPSQDAWNLSATHLGYPAFQVGSKVKTFQGYGLGSYVVFIDTTATLHDQDAFDAPDTPGVQFHNAFGVWISGPGGLDSVVNGVGGPVTSTAPGVVTPVDVTSYP
jgi:hypothetical protein